MSKVREFLEYYAKAAKGVPAGRKAEEALVELCDMERRLAASESCDAATREACELIQSAAERLRKEGAASSDELRAAEARGFERAQEEASKFLWSDKARDFLGGYVPVNKDLNRMVRWLDRRIRAMKDETP